MLLAGDVGATKINLAIFRDSGEIIKEASFPSYEYKSFNQVLQVFLRDDVVDKACFAIAGPVSKNKSKLTNLLWEIDGDEIKQKFQIPSVKLINDLEAFAYSIEELSSDDFFVINKGLEGASGNRVVISAGSGLGEGGVFWDGKRYHPFASEGGHCGFSPRNDLEIDLLKKLQKKFGHVSWERIVSGPGFIELYSFLLEKGEYKDDIGFSNHPENKDLAKTITLMGITGKSPICKRVVQWFISLYGSEAGNLALKMLATGGVFIGGGIAPKIINEFKNNNFMDGFLDKGRFRKILSNIPVILVINDKAPLIGAATYAKNN